MNPPGELSALSEAERQELLRLARGAITAVIHSKPDPPLQLFTPSLLAQNGAFVSIHAQECLRGCVGSVHPRGPLYETVVAMARAAAFEDPRFPPLTARELDAVQLEVSRLSGLKRIEPSTLVIGRHGLYVVRGPARGVLLPQVATRFDWDPVQFLRQTCLKAGLHEEAWQDPSTEIFAFEAEVFGESQGEGTY
jgi:AmmeMemoRadiSam system protein A